MMRPRLYKTSRGLPVIFLSDRAFNTATVLVLVKTGTDYEVRRVNGLAHFIEHLFFKGTERYPTPKELALELDKIGAEYNAFTGHQLTGYYIKTKQEQVGRAIELLAEMLIRPKYEVREIEKERQVIFQEINYNADTPTRLIHDLNTKLLYGDQPAGWSILGTKQSVSQIRPTDIRDYFSKHYTTQNTVVIVVGRFKPTSLLRLIEQEFAAYPSCRPPTAPHFHQSPNQFRQLIKVKPELQQGHLLLSFQTKGLAQLHDRRYSLCVLSSLLGSGFSSRLFLLLREELGATYYLSVDLSLLTNRGYLFVQTGADLNRLQEIIVAIKQELAQLKQGRIDTAELEKAKTILSSQLLMTTETSDATARFFGETYLLEKKLLTLADVSKKIQQVNLRLLQRELLSLLQFSQASLVMLLPHALNFSVKKIFKTL